MKRLIFLLSLLLSNTLVFAHDHGGDIARECLREGMIEATYITETHGVVRCFVEGMEMMGPRNGATRYGSCLLIQMSRSRVMMTYNFVDGESEEEPGHEVRRRDSAYDEAIDCFREALR